MHEMHFDEDGDRLFMLDMVDQGEKDSLLVWDLKENKEIMRKTVPNYYGVLAYNKQRNEMLTVKGPAVDLHAARKEKMTVLDKLMGKKHEPFYDHHGENIVAWNLDTGEETEKLIGAARSKPGDKIEYRVNTLEFSPDGSLLCTVDSWSGSHDGAPVPVRDGKLMVWSWPEKKILFEWTITDKYYGYGSQVAFINNEKILISGSKRTALFNIKSAEIEWELDGYTIWSPTTTSFIRVGNNQVSILSGENQSQIASYSYPKVSSFKNVCLSQNGRFLSWSTNSQTFHLFDLEKGKLLAPVSDSFEQEPSLQFGADGRLFAFDAKQAMILDKKAQKIAQLPWQSWIHAGSTKTYQSITSGHIERIHVRKDQVWDTVLGRKLASLASGHGYHRELYVSPNKQFAATRREKHKHLLFHDMSSGSVIGKIKSAKHAFFGNSLTVGKIYWNEDEAQAIIGDSSVSWFNEDKDIRQKNGFGTLCAAGIIDMKTSKRLHEFKNKEGKVAVSVNLLGASKQYIFGKASFAYTPKDSFGHWRLEPHEVCLWKRSDLSFIKNLPELQGTILFSKDESQMSCDTGVLDIHSGQFLKQFKASVMLSPSHTLNLKINEDAQLQIYDVMQDYLIWQQSVSNEMIRGADLFPVWHPAEYALGLTVKGKPLAIYVNLFKMPEMVGEKSLEEAIALLADQDVKSRMQGVAYCVAKPQQSLPLLQKLILDQKREGSLQQRMAVLALEYMARHANEEAQEHIAKFEGSFAAAAQLRLAAHREVMRRRETNTQAKPIKLTWSHGVDQSSNPPPPKDDKKPESVDDF